MNLQSHYNATSSPAQESAGAQTILVVDDHPELCNVASMLLSQCGYRVLTATSGEQAKAMARENPGIDLLLTDVEMPGMHGDELAAWFHVIRPRTQVVFMSGNPMQLRRLGPSHFVLKPFIFLDTLVAKIREVFDRGRAEVPASAAA
jgi:CheY-like chemotaxis protein